ncbi:hypothetical protein SAMN05444412_11827 [Rhodonellum ikkaensis]|uniref:Uncharacterized protein n=1 Tax=Rhodonellum ikkaensis TaxID=336829 RepID=A0A1H3TJB9_9BACT|nr:hypothetical protein SAMN05444412_11827 [Rhodonellum ikkaensis]
MPFLGIKILNFHFFKPNNQKTKVTYVSLLNYYRFRQVYPQSCR